MSLNDQFISLAVTMVRVTMLTLGAFAMAWFLRNIFNAQTNGEDANDETFISEWQPLFPEWRTPLSVVIVFVLLLIAYDRRHRPIEDRKIG